MQTTGVEALAGKIGHNLIRDQICAELAHKERQLMLVGDEKGNSLLIERLRQELAVLAPKAA